MAWKIVMTLDLPAYADINQDSFAGTGAQFLKEQCSSQEEIIALAHDADAVITISLYQKFTRKVIEGLHTCRIIANIGMGYEGIDIDAATDQGICVANVADYCLDEVAAGLGCVCFELISIHTSFRLAYLDAFSRGYGLFELLPEFG